MNDCNQKGRFAPPAIREIEKGGKQEGGKAKREGILGEKGGWKQFSEMAIVFVGKTRSLFSNKGGVRIGKS